MHMLTQVDAVRQQCDLYAREIVGGLKHFFTPLVLDSVEAIIIKTVQNGLKQFEERLQKTLDALELDSLVSLTQTPSKLEHVLLYVENYVMQTFRDLLIREPPVLSPSILLCDDPLKVLPPKPEKTKDDVLRDTLQEVNEDLEENLDPEGTPLVDHLVAKSVLTESDQESIATSSSRKEKTRKLLSFVSSSSADKIGEGFLSALDATHPEQANRFRERQREVEKRPPSPTCLPCKIRNEVGLDQIACSLFQRRKISRTEYKDLINPSVSNHKKWEIVMETNKKQEAVIESLDSKLGKYTDFYHRCKKLDIKTLHCQCPSLYDASRRRSSDVEILLKTQQHMSLQKSASASSLEYASIGSSLKYLQGRWESCDADLPSLSQQSKLYSGDLLHGNLVMRSSASSVANMSDFNSIGSLDDSWPSLVALPTVDFALPDDSADHTNGVKRSRNQDGRQRIISSTIFAPQDSDTSEECGKPHRKKGNHDD